jgi:hypothetical protein
VKVGEEISVRVARGEIGAVVKKVKAGAKASDE